MATRFVPNPAATKELQAAPEFKAGMAAITVGTAESIKAAALPFRGTGHYIDAIRPRGSRIHLESHFAHLIELGSVNNAPQANVRRGVREAGLRFVDDGPKQAD